jgi:hypothetical protein
MYLVIHLASVIDKHMKLPSYNYIITFSYAVPASGHAELLCYIQGEANFTAATETPI